MNMIELKKQLKEKGYITKIANGDCFDIHQNSKIHFLSKNEAIMLNKSILIHPIDLTKHAKKSGWNYIYNFEGEK